MAITTLYNNDQLIWLDIQAPTQEDFEKISATYPINPYFLQDTIDPNHFPKYENDDNLHFFLVRESIDQGKRNYNNLSDVSSKIGIFIFDTHLITIHRTDSQAIQTVLNKLKEKQHNDNVNPDHTALEIALAVLQSYDREGAFLLDKIDKIESEIFLEHNNANNINQIRRLYRIKRKSGLHYRALHVSTDWVENFKNLKLSTTQIEDLKDHHKDAMMDFEHLNNQITSLISMFLALSDQKANQVMKILAMFSVYFLPITFIAGVYGMNFDVMPELHGKYSYYITLGAMLLIVICIYSYFRQKKW